MAIAALHPAAATFAERVGVLGLGVEIASTDRAAGIAAEVDVLTTCTSVDIGAGR